MEVDFIIFCDDEGNNVLCLKPVYTNKHLVGCQILNDEFWYFIMSDCIESEIIVYYHK